jgi:hypothetical protein
MSGLQVVSRWGGGAADRRVRRAAAGEQRQREQQHEAEQQHGQRGGHRRRTVGLADQHDLHLQRLKPDSDAIVYSPSTTAIEMNAAERMPDQMLGTTTRRIVVASPHPATRRLGERLQVDGRQRGVDRAVGERQHQHDVHERQRQCGFTEEVRHPQVQRCAGRRR